VRDLAAQRACALAPGSEDLSDHDPLVAMLAGKPDPTGESRARRPGATPSRGLQKG